MPSYMRWGSLAALLGGLAFWFRRRKQKRIDPATLGEVSQQWFMDRRHDL